MSAVKSTLKELIDLSSNIISIFKSKEKLTTESLAPLVNGLAILFPITETLERTIGKEDVSGLDDVFISSIEANSSNLWNAATICLKDCNPDLVEFMCEVKLLGSILLSIHQNLKESLDGKLRCLKCMIKVFSNCVDENKFTLARKAQIYADKYLTSLEKIVHDSDPQKTELESQRLDLLFTNVEMAIKDQDFKMANIYLSRCELEKKANISKPSSIIEFCRKIFNACVLLNDTVKESTQGQAGKVVNNNLEDQVIDFLKKAANFLSLEIKYEPIAIYKTVKFNILMLLVECYLRKSDNESLMKCESCISFLEMIYPDKAEPYILGINLLKKTKPIDLVLFQQIVMKMIMNVDMKNCFDFMLSTINDFSNSDVLNTLHCLDYLITNKLNQEEHSDNFELAVNTRIWITINKEYEVSVSTKAKDLQGFMNSVEKMLTKGLSKEACLGAIVLFWTTGKKELKKHCAEHAIEWLRLASHRLIIPNLDDFEDVCKIQRSLIKGYLELYQYDHAYETYQKMTDKEQKNPLTIYLIFQIFKAREDEGSLRKCIKLLADDDSNLSGTVLAACLAEFKNNVEIIVEGLMALIKHSEREVDSILVAVAIRCNLQLILSESVKTNELNIKKSYFKLLASLLQATYGYVCGYEKRTESQTSSNVEKAIEIYSAVEIEWLSSNLFNTARYCYDSKLFAEGTSLANFSQKFTILLLNRCDNLNHKEDLTVWQMKTMLLELLCDYELYKLDKKGEEDQSVDKITVEKIIGKSILLKEFITKRGYPLEICDSEHASSYKTCFSLVISVQYEMEVLCGNWDVLCPLIKEAYENKEYGIGETFVSITKTSNCPKSTHKNILQSILNHEFERESISISFVSKLGRFIIGDFLESDNDLCASIANLIFSRIIAMKEKTYPEQELVWLATSFWNFGVNLIILGDLTNGSPWCDKAFQFAGLANERLEMQFRTLWPQLLKAGGR